MNTKLGPILLAEDDDYDAELTLIALGRRNLANRVERVRDGVEACEYLTCTGAHDGRSNGMPSLVMLDLKMPRMNGIDVIRTMKAASTLAKVPIVVLTSSRETPDVRGCYELGVNAYVVKPVGFEAFMEAVGELGLFWGLINEPPPAG